MMKCSAASAPVMNHLWPSIRQWLPSRVAVVRIIPAGSEPDPGWGSVITKAERTRPSAIGFSQRSCCASVAALASSIMLPSSGAALLNTTGPKMERFISS